MRIEREQGRGKYYLPGITGRDPRCSGPLVSRRPQLIGQLLVAEVTGVLLSRDGYEGFSPP
jgi:hypothetical protein